PQSTPGWAARCHVRVSASRFRSPGGPTTMFQLPAKDQTRRAARHRSASGGRGCRHPLVLETLEDRMLPSCTLSLVPSEPAPQLVGERITWTATATDCGDDPVYQFRVGPTGGPLRVVRDFSLDNTFAWAPMQEGTYEIRATVKDGYQAK